MGCLSSGIFWGVLIIVVGILVLIRVIFGVHIPIFSLIIGLLLIYFGVRVITGMSCSRRTKTVVFEDKKIEAVSGGKYDVVFGRNTVDLTGIELKQGATRVEVNTVFGSSIVKIDPAMPVKIRASAAFGSAKTPDQGIAGFGEHTFKSDTFKQAEAQNYLLVILNVVFGSSEVVIK
jgi:hypothetical protein